jgi:glucose-1-phosphate adenylyltransferase
MPAGGPSAAWKASGAMKGVVTAILGGGQGTRLWPLTLRRAKPAVPIGGKFRLIDIPISNSLHAGIVQIYVLTQFNSASLHRHIAQTYRFDVFREGFVNILAAEQSVENRDWYQGTADAVRQNLPRLVHQETEEVLILSGDQLYLMDLAGFVENHRERRADFSVAVKPVPRSEAPSLGIMRIDDRGRIIEFVEKPKDPAVIDSLALDAETIERLDLEAEPGTLLASMGIYVFRAAVLQELLGGTTAADFGKEVLPGAIADHRVQAFVHNGYWRDIGTIRTFHEANLELTAPLPALNLYSPDRPIYTHPRFLPGAKITGCRISHSIVADGSIIAGSRIARSIVGVRAYIQNGAEIEDSIVMGATEFEGGTPRGENALGIGRGAVVKNAIVDLNSRIGDGARLVNEAGVEEADGPGWSIRDGIIVVHRSATIPPGTVI